MSYKYGIISDPHFHAWDAFSTVSLNGINSRLDTQLLVAHKAMLHMETEGCSVVYFAGDMFHIRGKLTPSVLNPVSDLFSHWSKRLSIRVIPGNHDLEGRECRELTNSTQILVSSGCEVITEPIIFNDHGRDVFMVPWNPDIESLQSDLDDVAIAYRDKMDVFIHAPVNGVIMNIPDHGLYASYLKSLGYANVFAGHYHNNKNFGDGVYSIGALTHQTWSDVGTRAGYIINDNGIITHHETQAPKFIDYDLTWDEAQAAIECKGNYVRIVGEIDNPDAIREHLMKEHESAGVLVNAIPTHKAVVARTGSTVKSGASIQTSISDYIDNSFTGDDSEIEAIKRESIAILNMAEMT